MELQECGVSRVIAVIPARYESSRFPGKALADRTGKALIVHVLERVRQAATVERVIVATDDDRIRAAVKRAGGEAVMTRADHANGTSRIAEAVRGTDADLVANVQGDEPEIDPHLIDLAVEALEAHADCPVSTVASPFAEDEDPASPNIVKVVVDRRGRALYFSRALIPFAPGEGRTGAGAKPQGVEARPLKHVGMYVYRRPFLDEYVRMEPTPLEQAERLEQLRILEHGHAIAVAIGEAHHHGIDTPEQYEAFVQRWAGARGGA
jgi:3-deoxy-manno-octulosonate cytidylyltransferase (CMP-KDO synthetase)